MAAKSGTGKNQRRRDRGGRRKPKVVMPFEKRNYVMIVIGLIIVLAGYVIMAAENEVDGFLSLYVSPILLLAGYLEIIWAIVWRPKSDQVETA